MEGCGRGSERARARKSERARASTSEQVRDERMVTRKREERTRIEEERRSENDREPDTFQDNLWWSPIVIASSGADWRCQRQTEFSRAILPQVAAAACTENVRYTFRARGITTKWRTLEQRGDRRAGGRAGERASEREKGRRKDRREGGREGGRGRATEVSRGNERVWDGKGERTTTHGRGRGSGRGGGEEDGRKVRVACAG